jgi:hypothetical protein
VLTPRYRGWTDVYTFELSQEERYILVEKLLDYLKDSVLDFRYCHVQLFQAGEIDDWLLRSWYSGMWDKIWSKSSVERASSSIAILTNLLFLLPFPDGQSQAQRH